LIYATVYALQMRVDGHILRVFAFRNRARNYRSGWKSPCELREFSGHYTPRAQFVPLSHQQIARASKL
jgi:hypothetical protein